MSGRLRLLINHNRNATMNFYCIQHHMKSILFISHNKIKMQTERPVTLKKHFFFAFFSNSINKHTFHTDNKNSAHMENKEKLLNNQFTAGSIFEYWFFKPNVFDAILRWSSNGIWEYAIWGDTVYVNNACQAYMFIFIVFLRLGQTKYTIKWWISITINYYCHRKFW